MNGRGEERSRAGPFYFRFVDSKVDRGVGLKPGGVVKTNKNRWMDGSMDGLTVTDFRGGEDANATAMLCLTTATKDGINCCGVILASLPFSLLPARLGRILVPFHRRRPRTRCVKLTNLTNSEVPLSGRAMSFCFPPFCSDKIFFRSPSSELHRRGGNVIHRTRPGEWEWDGTDLSLSRGNQIVG